MHTEQQANAGAPSPRPPGKDDAVGHTRQFAERNRGVEAPEAQLHCHAGRLHAARLRAYSHVVAAAAPRASRAPAAAAPRLGHPAADHEPVVREAFERLPWLLLQPMTRTAWWRLQLLRQCLSVERVRRCARVLHLSRLLDHGPAQRCSAVGLAPAVAGSMHGSGACVSVPSVAVTAAAVAVAGDTHRWSAPAAWGVKRTVARVNCRGPRPKSGTRCRGCGRLRGQAARQIHDDRCVR
eukprot:353839-Chlamydomonas_euryale.AAC.22